MAQGCYTPLYLDCSFKGIPFQALDTSSEHGRRGAEGEFPFGENTAYQDMGRKIRRYQIRGRFAENSHIADSSALIAACEAVGPGVLVHPTRGIVNVACKSCKVSDNPLEEQGVTYVDLEFVEANQWVNGFNFTNFLTSFDISPIIATGKSIIDNFYTPDTVFAHRRENLLNVAENASVFVRDIFEETSSRNPSELTYRALSEIDLINSVESTFLSGESVSDVIFQTLSAINAVTDTDEKFDLFRRIANQFAQVSTSTFDAETSENAIYSGIRIAAGAYLAQSSIERTPERLQSAFVEYDIVTTVLENEISNTLTCNNTESHIILRNNLSDIKGALLNRAYNLPATVIYNFNSSVHALVAAYEIFDDAKRYQELLDRNPHQPVYSMGPEIAATSANVSTVGTP